MKATRMIIALSLLTLAACNNYDIQPEQSEGFIKFFSSNLTEEGVDVKPTGDGGYVAMGTSTNEDGTSDIYLVKTDQYGNEASWSPAIIGTDQDDVGNSLQVVSDGFVILGASKMHPDSSYDMYLVKTDLQGNVLWETWNGGDGADQGNDLLARPDGGFIAAGLTYSYGQGIANAYIVQFDANGIMTYQDAEGFVGRTISSVRLSEGEHFYFLCAVVAEEDFRMYTFGFDKDVPNMSTYYNPTVQRNIILNNTIALPGGDFLICGQHQGSTSSEAYLVRLRPASTNWQTTFSVVWEQTFAESGDAADFSGNAVRVISADTYGMIGTKSETGNDDMVLIRVDGSGTEIDRSYYGDEGFQRGHALEVTAGDGGIIIVGTNGAEDNSMISLVKTDASGRL